MATKTTPKAQVFDLKKLQLLAQGRTNEVMARTDVVTVTGKVYAEGGENALHTHTNQDHGFLVLSGQATFHDENEETKVVGPFEGILLPAGAYYWFQSTGKGNLVMMRFAGKLDGAQQGGDDRVDPDGNPFPGDDPANKQVTRVPIPDTFFGG